jgi:hypothetical protein
MAKSPFFNSRHMGRLIVGMRFSFGGGNTQYNEIVQTDDLDRVRKQPPRRSRRPIPSEAGRQESALTRLPTTADNTSTGKGGSKRD